MKTRGFTLVELVLVIGITGILAAALTVFLKPAIDSYFDSRRRADLSDMADTALRRMRQDIGQAVPNSVRSVSASCFQLVPTLIGGRYRMDSDTVNDTPTPLPCTPSGTCSAPLDVTQATTVFDVLTPLTTLPAVNDWVVIDNQNADDVYTGTNRGQISALGTPRATDGLHRLTVNSTAFPSGYDGGSFVVVPNAAQTVFYSCVGNVLYRTVATFAANQAATCALTSGAVVATDVAACSFVYDSTHGATEQSGFVWMRLELSRSGESIALAHGVHVDNLP
ncbi:type II secretion system protein [Propionivibrio sp.]|uniref:type II secretion system protein n=1 Tax=Propionivibrio sp. TaxID=2212460 RepID=UPI00262295B1|nr:type II secretion system protein [Propionivibrio sp.]